VSESPVSSPSSSSPETFLKRALALAARGRYGASPNPMVGSVVVRHGEVIGEGWHRRAGGPHAEVEALRRAGAAARGADLHVTLEPCSHHGRTPPCVDAILDAGIARVFACHADPDPRVAGSGFARLRAAGVEVRHGFLVEEAVRLNWRFLTSVVHGRPGVTLKWAMTLDGRIATRSGHSQWISSPSGRRWGLAEREEHDAILVGSGTVLADDPRLDRRLGKAATPILRVVLDRRLRTPPDARLFSVDGPVIVYTTGGAAGRRAELEAAGAEVVVLGAVDPPSVLADLDRRGMRSLLVEGGAEVAAAFLEARAFDRVAVDIAPRLIGGRGAPGPLGGEGFERLEDGVALEGLRVRRRGADIILEGFRASCLRDLSAPSQR
jgi:diaminohydroxyphosphoribosylaminopyrimidine deaminase / 5-amino-6-(5-phosphoribosylamino)uracil reductase